MVVDEVTGQLLIVLIVGAADSFDQRIVALVGEMKLLQGDQ